MGRRRANAYSEDNPFSGDSAANEFSTPEDRQKPVTTRPRGGEVDRGAGDPDGLDLSVDTDPSDDHVPMETPMARRKHSTQIRPASPSLTPTKSCFVGGCSGTATFEVWNSGEPDEYACDDHVGALAGNLAKQEREKLGRDRWASRQSRAVTEGDRQRQAVRKQAYTKQQWSELLRTFFILTGGEHLGASSRSENTGRRVLDQTGSVAQAAEAAAAAIGSRHSHMEVLMAHDEALGSFSRDRRRAFIEPGNQDRVPDVGNNPSHDPSEPRAEDRWQERAGQNYDTLWRGQRDEPYYDPLDPVYPRPGDEPDNVAEYAEDTGVEPADPQAAPAAPRPDKSARRSKQASFEVLDVGEMRDAGGNVFVDFRSGPLTGTLYYGIAGGVGDPLSGHYQVYVGNDNQSRFSGDARADFRRIRDDESPFDYASALARHLLQRNMGARRQAEGLREPNKVSIRCATCGQQGKIALEKVSTKTRCKCGSPFVDFTDRIAKAQQRKA